tara:strand:- start:21 stop:326 length:306 start_codon:yes stop_codon:yes gene_type:complete
MTGNQLLDLCEDKKGSIGEASCLGYVVGLREMYNLTMQMNLFIIRNDKYQPVKSCLPHKLTGNQLKQIITKWLNNNPEKLHEEVVVSFVYIDNETFPCKNN